MRAFVPANLAGVKIGRVVEVSGFRNSTARWLRRVCRASPSSDDRVVGKLSSLDQSTLTFLVDALRVDYSNASLIEGSAGQRRHRRSAGAPRRTDTLRAQKGQVEGGLEGEPAMARASKGS